MILPIPLDGYGSIRFSGLSGAIDRLLGIDGRAVRMARALSLLETAQSAGNLSPSETTELLRQAVDWLPQIEPDMNAIANARAVALLESHRRVRQATHTGRVTIKPQLPLDVLGVFVLMPVPKRIVTKV